MSIQAIILLGAPGAGKGTMAEAIRSATPFIHVSTGDMLREAIMRLGISFIQKMNIVGG